MDEGDDWQITLVWKFALVNGHVWHGGGTHSSDKFSMKGQKEISGADRTKPGLRGGRLKVKKGFRGGSPVMCLQYETLYLANQTWGTKTKNGMFGRVGVNLRGGFLSKSVRRARGPRGEREASASIRLIDCT